MAVISSASRSTAPPGSLHPRLLPNTLSGPETPIVASRDRFDGDEPYSPARDLLPTGWSPVLETVEELGCFAGAADERGGRHRPARVAGKRRVRARRPHDRIRELRLSPVPSCGAVRSGLLDLAARAAHRIRRRRVAASRTEAVRGRRRRVSVGDVAANDAVQREPSDRGPASRKRRRCAARCRRRSDPSRIPRSSAEAWD